MRPITVSVVVPTARRDVYDYLDVLANHEQFTDHMMREWHLTGPARGRGARARVCAVLAGRDEQIDIEVVTAEPPVRTVERNIGAGGRRVATGAYSLEELPDDHTRITFQYTWEQVPLGERLAAPVVRRVMRKAMETAMHRLGERLGADAAERGHGPAEPDAGPDRR